MMHPDFRSAIPGRTSCTHHCPFEVNLNDLPEIREAFSDCIFPSCYSRIIDQDVHWPEGTFDRFECILHGHRVGYIALECFNLHITDVSDSTFAWFLIFEAQIKKGKLCAGYCQRTSDSPTDPYTLSALFVFH